MKNSARPLSRRDFLGVSGGAAASLALLGPARALAGAGDGPFGDLVPDPGGLLDLPHGFQYRVLSPEGAPTMRNRATSGIPVPGNHDGMAAFAGPRNTTVLVRNHELSTSGSKPKVIGTNAYTAAPAGGTTAVVVGPNRKELDSYVTNAGTWVNCAGGGTPWGTWVTCEETRTTAHGYCFEVMPDDPENNLSKTPIVDMGFFSHEAIDVDPRTGIVYLTEDDFRGSIPANPNDEIDGNPAFRSSFLYRFLPNNRSQRPGALLAGGTLQALAIDSAPRNADLYTPGQTFVVRWITVNALEPHDDALAKGAVRFNRLEGCHFAGGAYWFDDTAGGEARRGQVFRLIPGPEGVAGADTLELFSESMSANDLDNPDNVIVTPWGDVWLAEDGGGENRIVGITPEGRTYVFARNAHPDMNEFAGPTFAPDGNTFFVNVQDPGTTFAIWGPFARQNRARQRLMAYADPPAHYAPRLSGEQTEAAERYGLTRLQAAAYDRLGIPLV
ncbi:MAG: PhoX family protein [Actinomycetota bacterium]|nr:PhoX family protein [Actinomycetota bacterium]